MIHTKPFNTLLVATLFAVAAPAMADSDEQYYQQNQSRLISYEQAAKVAQQTVAGSSVEDVEFDKEYNGAFFDVELRDAQGREYDVRVNAETGKVVYSRRDY